jgi:hypothetical protein
MTKISALYDLGNYLTAKVLLNSKKIDPSISELLPHLESHCYKFEKDTNVQIQKYYVFKSQYDIQIFSDLSYIDNNGRGGLLIGKCKIN